MPESIGQKIRNQMNLPLHKKSRFFWLLFPLFFLISLIIHYVSFKRRKKSYSELNSIQTIQNFNSENLKIICVGNVIIGGTGKSPVVQKIAQLYLSEGYIVAIASRGIGQNIKPLYVHNHSKSDEINLLSDENREHYEILKKFFYKESNIFYILQNKERLSSLEFLITELKTRDNLKNLKCVFILDDGLQHFSCPRHMNLCLWSTDILLNSPHFPMPIGPYREGFGKNSFQSLLNYFDFRLWSRVEKNNTKKYIGEIKECLNKYNLSISNKDIIVTYENIFFKLDCKNNHFSIGDPILTSELTKSFENQKSISLISGIANPNKLLSDLKSSLHISNLDYIFLNDHGNITNKALELIKNSEILLFTLKDFFRWCQHPVFLNMIKDKNIILCSIEVSFKSIENENMDIIKKITF